MSVLFFDHLLGFNSVKEKIALVASSEEEKHELWQIVDQIIHHRVLGCVLDNLDVRYHAEFLERFQESPYERELMDYLNEKIEDLVEVVIKEELKTLKKEILNELKAK